MPTTQPNDPILLRARQGWVLYDWANSAFATVMLTAVFPVFFVSLVPDRGYPLHLLGWVRVVPASALWGYLVSASIALVAIFAPWLGALADHGRFRLRLLALLGLTGAMATVLVGLVPAPTVPLAMLLFLLGNLGFAGGNLFYNALLPFLAGPAGVDRLSSRGYAVGYIGGGLALLLVFLLVLHPEGFGLADKAAAVRLGFVITGLWWALFALPCYLWVPEPPAAPRSSRPGYWETLLELRRHPVALLFLLAFLCYNDGIQTLITVSSVFATDELKLSQSSILGCFLMIQFLAMPGTLLCNRLAGRIGVKRTILGTLVLFTGITLYATVMQTATQFWVLGALVALALGGSQALSRSLFARLIPPEKTAEFFGFFAISSKFAAILGPLTFGLCADLTGSTRYAVLPLAIFFAVGGALLTRVPVPADVGNTAA